VSVAAAEVIFMRRAVVHDSPGDHAFEQVYRSSYSTLVGQLFLLTTNRAEAEDVVQEAFARLWGNWRELRGYDNHEAWVRRVAMNLAISRWRRHSRQASYQEPAVPASGQISSLADLTLALRGVSVKHRQALLLHYVIGLSVAEVALEMSAKPGTVKSWLSRGRAELERQLHYQEAGGND
jgi:RNA polymerase sigma-70 factor (ECF subfamily)